MDIRLDSFPFDSKVSGYDDYGNPVFDRAVGAYMMRKTFAQFFTNGIFGTPAEAFQISKNDTGLRVNVAEGLCIIEGAMGYVPDGTVLTLDETTPQGKYAYGIFLRYDENVETRSISLVARKGEAGASPIPPSPELSLPGIRELRIGYVVVPSGATDVSEAEIFSEKGEDVCPYAAPFAEIDISGILEDVKAKGDEAYQEYLETVQLYYDYIAAAVDGTFAGQVTNQIAEFERRVSQVEADSITADKVDGKTIQFKDGIFSVKELGIGTKQIADASVTEEKIAKDFLLPPEKGGTGVGSINELYGLFPKSQTVEKETFRRFRANVFVSKGFTANQFFCHLTSQDSILPFGNMLYDAEQKRVYSPAANVGTYSPYSITPIFEYFDVEKGSKGSSSAQSVTPGDNLQYKAVTRFDGSNATFDSDSTIHEKMSMIAKSSNGTFFLRMLSFSMTKDGVMSSSLSDVLVSLDAGAYVRAARAWMHENVAYSLIGLEKEDGFMAFFFAKETEDGVISAEVLDGSLSEGGKIDGVNQNTVRISSEDGKKVLLSIYDQEGQKTAFFDPDKKYFETIVKSAEEVPIISYTGGSLAVNGMKYMHSRNDEIEEINIETGERERYFGIIADDQSVEPNVFASWSSEDGYHFLEVDNANVFCASEDLVMIKPGGVGINYAAEAKTVTTESSYFSMSACVEPFDGIFVSYGNFDLNTQNAFVVAVIDKE